MFWKSGSFTHFMVIPWILAILGLGFQYQPVIGANQNDPTHTGTQTITHNLLPPDYQLQYCDADGDGFMEFTIATLWEDLEISPTDPQFQESIIIGTDGGYILRMDSPGTSPSITEICQLPTGTQITDVAVDQDQNIFFCTYDYIARLNTSDCSYSIVLQDPTYFGINSLSFDLMGNLLFGVAGSNNSNVYRMVPPLNQAPTVWHDFTSGDPGGDFVMLNGNMYIAWRETTGFRLFEVTLDTNLNYVSHTDIGPLPFNTYGLASEAGQLYGVSSNRLYQINVTNAVTTDLANNNFVYGEWWGIAGLHEAGELMLSLHETETDAQNGTNGLTGIWTNTVSGGQTLYIRIENTLTGEVTLQTLDLIINTPPVLQAPQPLSGCADTNGQSTFNLDDIIPSLNPSPNSGIGVSYHISQADADSGSNPMVPFPYTISGNQETLFVRVTLDGSDCYATEVFELRSTDSDVLAEISGPDPTRTDTSCTAAGNGDTYFDLDASFNLFFPNLGSDWALSYYTDEASAQAETAPLTSPYYTSDFTEIFVRAAHPNGCIDVSNFFLEPNCEEPPPTEFDYSIPTYFSPNGDTHNPYWNLQEISAGFPEQTQIQIFNRYGKLLYRFNPTESHGWDGTYQGRPMPASDYWFSLFIPDTETITGHFSLIR